MIYGFYTFCIILVLLACVNARPLDLTQYSFKSYLKEFRKSYNSDHYDRREQIFNARIAEIIAHNANPHKTYSKGINHMTDWSDEEFKNLLGYDKSAGYKRRHGLRNLKRSSNVDLSSYPKSIDWRTLGAVTPVKNQGSCGSCWTFASAQSVESAWYLETGELQELSQQQIAGCTHNPTHCGGHGGCEGGVAGLAFESIKTAGGLATEWTYPYISYFGKDFDCAFNSSAQVIGAKVKGHVDVASNDYGALMDAINLGPVSISVDASAFHTYEKGVFTDCDMKKPEINHAVQLVGYGSDSAFGDYWLVRNSWGPTWGENGYIRLQRSADAACGQDTNPSEGSGCDDGPDEVTVCGACGILYDNNYPIVDVSDLE